MEASKPKPQVDNKPLLKISIFESKGRDLSPVKEKKVGKGKKKTLPSVVEVTKQYLRQRKFSLSVDSDLSNGVSVTTESQYKNVRRKRPGSLKFHSMGIDESAALDPNILHIYKRINSVLQYHEQLIQNKISGDVQVEFSINEKGQLVRFWDTISEDRALEGYVLYVLYKALERPIKGLNLEFKGIDMKASFTFSMLTTAYLKSQPKIKSFKNSLNFYRATQAQPWAVTARELNPTSNRDRGEKVVSIDIPRIAEWVSSPKKKVVKNQIQWNLLYRKSEYEKRCHFQNIPSACHRGAKLAQLFGEFEKASRYSGIACRAGIDDACKKYLN